MQHTQEHTNKVPPNTESCTNLTSLKNDEPRVTKQSAISSHPWAYHILQPKINMSNHLTNRASTNRITGQKDTHQHCK